MMLWLFGKTCFSFRFLKIRFSHAYFRPENRGPSSRNLADFEDLGALVLHVDEGPHAAILEMFAGETRVGRHRLGTTGYR